MFLIKMDRVFHTAGCNVPSLKDYTHNELGRIMSLLDYLKTAFDHQGARIPPDPEAVEAVEDALFLLRMAGVAVAASM